MPRRSPIRLLVCFLALATGLTLLRLSDLLAEDPAWSAPTSADTGANAALARGFYDAVNATLRTGRPADLERLLAAGFVAHGGSPGLPSTRAGFVDRLLTLRATFPTLRLQPQDTLAQSDVIVVRVHVEGTSSGTFLGLPLAGELAAWGTVDVLRIGGGMIAEFWGGREDAPLLQPLHEVPLDLPSSALQTLALERTTVAPGASVAAGGGLGPVALYLEGGRLTAAVAGVARRWQALPAAGADLRESVAPGSETALAPGDLLLLAQGSRAMIRNDGDVSAAYLSIAVQAPGGPSASGDSVGPETAATPPISTPRVTTADLAGRPLTALPSGPTRLGLGRVTLAPGATLPIAASGVALLAIEAGSVGLANTEETIWSRRGADGSITTATTTTLSMGDAVLFEPGAAGDVQSVAEIPLVLLVVTITPALPADGLTTASSQA